jgi:hypothetical protein
VSTVGVLMGTGWVCMWVQALSCLYCLAGVLSWRFHRARRDGQPRARALIHGKAAETQSPGGYDLGRSGPVAWSRGAWGNWLTWRVWCVGVSALAHVGLTVAMLELGNLLMFALEAVVALALTYLLTAFNTPFLREAVTYIIRLIIEVRSV